MDRRSIFILAPAFLLSGCIALPIPHDRPRTPLYTGMVTDISTKTPIESVVVTVVDLNPLRGDTPSQIHTKTDPTGHYEAQVTMSSSWFVLLFLPAHGYCQGRLVFSHPEYESVTRETSQPETSVYNGTCTFTKVKLDVQLTRRSRAQSGS